MGNKEAFLSYVGDGKNNNRNSVTLIPVLPFCINKMTDLQDICLVADKYIVIFPQVQRGMKRGWRSGVKRCLVGMATTRSPVYPSFPLVFPPFIVPRQTLFHTGLIFFLPFCLYFFPKNTLLLSWEFIKLLFMFSPE